MELDSWIGREDREQDTIDALRARRLHALLDHSVDELQPGAMLPLGYHWLYCVSVTPRSEFGADGHARRGGFLPPFPGTRRMWGGGSLTFLRPLHIGDTIERHSVIEHIEQKQGRSGPFHIVRIVHQISSQRGPAIEEHQHLIYMPVSTQPTAASLRPFADPVAWQETFTADEVVLFYFSALTMNGHRIHYDQPYATREEGHPGLLVHAPLTALLLLDAAVRHDYPVRQFEYRALAPLYCGDVITLAGQPRSEGAVALWAWRPDRGVAVQAKVTT